MIHNVPLSLDRDFELSIQELATKYGENFEILNGLHQSQLDFSEFIDNFIDHNTADVTIDANANASRSKDVRSLLVEQTKSQNKLFSFNKIFYEMKKAYGLKVAKEWLELEWIGAFYLHDASSASLLPYCYAMSLERVAKEGLFFLNQYKTEPPKHLTTYFDDVLETISFFSNLSSGAFGMPDLLLWAFYYWKKDVANGYFLKDPTYYAKQNFQKFIFRTNQPYLRVTQTSFTNVSIFDRNYYEALFGGTVFPDGTYAIDYMEEFIEFEKLFVTVQNEVRSENVFAFPVTTICLLYKDGEFKDKEFARWMSDANSKYFIANFFQSSSTGTLSNCLSRDTRIVTDSGVKSFGEMREGEHIRVLDMYGQWQPAVVHYYGKQYMNVITLKSNRTEKQITATPNHTWILADGTKTTDLQVGDVLWDISDTKWVVKDIKPLLDNGISKPQECWCVEQPINHSLTLEGGIVTGNCCFYGDTLVDFRITVGDDTVYYNDIPFREAADIVDNATYNNKDAILEAFFILKFIIFILYCPYVFKPSLS